MSAMDTAKAEEIFAVLTGYQHALTSHMDWLRTWYEAVLNREEHARLPEAGAESCPFTAWYGSAGLFAALPGFDELGRRHGDIHAKAEQMSARAAAGQTLTTSDYEVLMSLVLAFSVAAQSVEREAWRMLATIDPLTGLGNRQTMMTQLVAERDRSSRQRQPCSVALADIDHFKKINDTYGHAQGDKVLRAVANCLKQAVRPYDIVYRYGGEEFLVCLPGADTGIGAKVMDRIRQTVSALTITDDKGGAIPVTFTVGLAEMSDDLSVEDAIERADQALYDGKRGGRNRVCVWQAREV